MRLRTIYILAPLLLLIAPSLYSQNLKLVPHTDPVNSYLERAYVLGWIDYLSNMRPYTEGQVLAHLAEIRSYFMDHPNEETPLQRDQLNGFLERFKGERYHMLRKTWDPGGELILETPAHFDFASRLNEISNTAPRIGPAIFLSFDYNDRIYFNQNTSIGFGYFPNSLSPYRKFHEPPLHDQNVNTWFLGSGTEGFNHQQDHPQGNPDISYFVNSVSQTSIDFNLGTFHLGRGTFSWGPSPLVNVSLSNLSKPYEYFALSLPLGTWGSASSMVGFLEDVGDDYQDIHPKLISIHRAEVQFFDWFLFSFYESVIYSQRFEIVYLLPFSIYYVAEVRKGDYDNKQLGFDFVFRFPPAKIYLSTFADDWTFSHQFSLGYYHNEIAILLGVELVDLIPRTQLILEYALLTHYMYTHKESFDEEEKVHNYNNYEHFNTHLGHFLNPNSHMIRLSGKCDLAENTILGADLWFTQDGRGDINTPPDWAKDMELYGVDNREDLFFDFLDGIRESNFDFTLSAEHRIPFYGLRFKASYSLEHTWNVGKVEGENRWDHKLLFEASFLAE